MLVLPYLQSLLRRRKTNDNSVNIFHKHIYRVSALLSAHCKNLLFCVPKAAVLHGKSVGFALQKSRFRNVKAQLSLFNGIYFTKLE